MKKKNARRGQLRTKEGCGRGVSKKGATIHAT